MKRILATACMAALTFAASAQPPNPAAAAPLPVPDAGPVKAGDLTLESNVDKASYAIGMDIGRNFKRAGVELNLDALTQGFKDSHSGADPAMTDDQMQQVMQEFQQTMMAKMQEAQKREAEQFLTAKAAEEGVKKTESGLMYKVVEEGSGASPKAGDNVRVHYTGMLADGKEFDSSHKRGEPAEFEVGRVIKGWQEALQMMKPGSHWKLYIPGDLAYGPRGNPQGGIPPNAPLEFDVQLLEILPKAANEVTIPQGNEVTIPQGNPNAQ